MFLEFRLKYNILSPNDKEVLPIIKPKPKNFVPKKKQNNKTNYYFKESFVSYPTKGCIVSLFCFWRDCFGMLNVSDGACSVIKH
jgi:hypothetical protein